MLYDEQLTRIETKVDELFKQAVAYNTWCQEAILPQTNVEKRQNSSDKVLYVLSTLFFVVLVLATVACAMV